MPELKVVNKTELQPDETIIRGLEKIVSDWQKENDFPVHILICDSDSENLFDFKRSKEAQNILERGIGFNLFMADIDIFLKKQASELKNKVRFSFLIGFEKEKIEKNMENKSEKNEKTGLNLVPAEPKYSISQVILPENIRLEIERVLALLKNMGKIYYDWGFSEIDPVPRSVVNLWGPPGTGKTMAVHAIAKEMGKKILVLNYADIESKYVGEAPKNLIAAFNLAEKEDAVIFFDEADSFLGKRITNVDSGSEQAINSLRSQMLMKLEEFRGIVFFATNLHENYDRAFESRILKHIEFKLPDAETRKHIIKGKLPEKAPYGSGTHDDEFLTQLAGLSEGFSGREIKNCILEILIRASQTENQLVTAEIMTETFKAKKEEMDAAKRKVQERKDNLSAQIQTNLKTKNYKTKKLNKRRK